MRKVKVHCEERGMLLIFDEAQTAFGRLGCDFAFELFGVEPDILTLSKTLGGGLPLSATVISEAMEADCHEKGFIHPTSHVSDPLPAQVALAVLDVLEEEGLNARALKMGEALSAGLRYLKDKHEIIGDVRGFGLLQGVELVKDRETRAPDAATGRAITARCMELGLSMNIVSVGSMAAIWRIAPPLTVTREEIERGVAILDQAIGEVAAQGAKSLRRAREAVARRGGGLARQRGPPGGRPLRTLRYLGRTLERAKGFEPSTPTLARLCSTPELHPHPLDGVAAAGRAYGATMKRMQHPVR